MISEIYCWLLANEKTDSASTLFNNNNNINNNNNNNNNNDNSNILIIQPLQLTTAKVKIIGFSDVPCFSLYTESLEFSICL